MLLPVDVVVDRVNKLLKGWGVSPALPARTRYVLIEIDDVSPNKLASIEEVEIQSDFLKIFQHNGAKFWYNTRHRTN